MTPMARRAAAGFTLVEVLVALTIVAVAIGAGIRAAGALTQNAQRLLDVTAAQWCAENQLTGLRITTPVTFPDVGDSDFSCEQMGVTYGGKLVVRPTPNPSFRRADAQIFDEQGQPLLTVSTVLSRF